MPEEPDMSYEPEYFLRVETDRGFIRLPLTDTEVIDGREALIFNWVVHEEAITIKSVQPFLTALVNGDEIVANSIKDVGDGGVGTLQPLETACWIIPIKD
jgi:hypothetical protein